MHIEQKKSGKNIKIYICKKQRVIDKNGKSVPKSFIIRKLGNKDDLEKEHGENLNKYLEEQIKLEESNEENKLKYVRFNKDEDLKLDEQMCFNFGYIYPQTILSKLKLKEFLDTIADQTKIEYNFSQIVIDLIISQIINPQSKRGFYNSPSLYGKEKNYDLHHVYRALDILAENADKINNFAYKALKKYKNLNSQIYYYDCTNFYFETENCDEFRQNSKSKEGIYAPLVQLGALIDDKGFIVGMLVFKGAKNEQETLKTLEQRIEKQFSLKNIIICTDAGLNSGDNRYFNSQEGRSFICTQPLSRLRKHIKTRVKDDSNRQLLNGDKTDLTPKKIEELYKNAKGNDVNRYLDIVIYKVVNIKEDIKIKDENNKNPENSKEDKGKEKSIKKITIKNFEQTLIVSYSLKYKLMQYFYFNKDLHKAQQCILNPSEFNKDTAHCFKRLVKNLRFNKDSGEITSQKLTLNEEKIEKELEFFGYYCVATNYEATPSEIVSLNKYRWNIEYMFRTMKTNLNAHPIYVRTENHIRGHLEIVCLAINVLRALHSDMYKAMDKTAEIGKLDINDKDYGLLTIDNILTTLKEINLTKLNTAEEVFVPSFTRTKLTDTLGKTYGIVLSKSVIGEKTLKKFK